MKKAKQIIIENFETVDKVEEEEEAIEGRADKAGHSSVLFIMKKESK